MIRPCEREVGLAVVPEALGRPAWDSQTMELRLDGRLVRRVARWAPTLIALLDAFEAAGWEETINNPLPQSTKRYNQKLRDAVRELNYGQEVASITFEVCEGGMQVRWRALE